MTKAIIFDIGGVVVFTDFKNLYQNFAARAGIPLDFILNYHANPHRSELLLGHIGLEQFFLDMQQRAAVKNHSVQDLKNMWREETLQVRRPNRDVIKWIDANRKKITIGALTNLTPGRLMLDKETKLYSHFDFAVLSCAEHLKKPDPAFFQIALNKARATADETVFIDDKPEHIAAAQALGIKGLLFTTTARVLEQLQNLP